MARKTAGSLSDTMGDSQFDLSHPSLEASPAIRRFLAAVPPLEQKQCLRAALVHGVRHFLNLQSQGTILSLTALRQALADFTPDSNAQAQTMNISGSVLRRDSQPGSGLTSFPFVDESRFEIEHAPASSQDEDEDTSKRMSIGSKSRNDLTAHAASLNPPNAVFASYPNWWPLNDVVKAREALSASSLATAAAAAEEPRTVSEEAVASGCTNNGIENQEDETRDRNDGNKLTEPESCESAGLAEPHRAAEDVRTVSYRSKKSEDTRGSVAAVSAASLKKPEVIVAIPGRRDILAARKASERGTKDDGIDLIDPVPPPRIRKFKARKAPPRQKSPSNGGGGATARRLRNVKSKIGSEVKAYRAAARKAKISRDAAMDSVMGAYAEKSRERRGSSSLEAYRLASAVIDSGIVADLLAESSAPDVEVYALPRPGGRTGILEESRRTYSDIMNEIELAAQAGHVAEGAGLHTASRHEKFSNYSDWVGDYGPPHTRNWRTRDNIDRIGIEDIEEAAAGELEARF